MKRNLIIAAAVAGLAITACSEKAREPFRDAGQQDPRNSSPAQVIEMPDGFSNAATKCDHGNRIYIAFHGDSKYAAIAVVKDDTSCAGRG